MPEMIVARYQQQLDDLKCRCELCPRHCVIKPGRHGFCLHRFNENGELKAEQYGQVAALGMDPIEKKPLYHFHPGRNILSVGANGCNLACKFCQNWHLSAGEASTRYVSPEQLADQAGKKASIGLAFTYNEPMIWFEYILDTAALLRPRGLAVVLVSNGYLEQAPFDELIDWVNAINVDVKGDESFYRELTDGHAEPVRRNVEEAVRRGVHVEVTHLLVTGANDEEEKMRELVDWLSSISRKVPLHISRYFPNHKYHAAPTSASMIELAVSIAREKLDFVYAGNIQLADAADTKCPQCGTTVVERLGYHTVVVGVTGEGACGECGADLSLVV